MSTSPLSTRELERLRGAIPKLHAWYRASARPLPWRNTRDPYAIWVSEIMLQQTRVATAIPYYERWMAEFPTVEALAEAPEHRVLLAWEGLGYYSRARNLHMAAKSITERFQGRIPEDPDAFRDLPGIGPYTTAAVMSIAFGLDLAAVDGNVRRVLSRLLASAEDLRRSPHSAALNVLARDLLPPGTGALHNQAMMELGATVCTPRAPACAQCPIRNPCKAWQSGEPEAFPPRTRRGETPHYDVAVGLVFQGGHVFIDQRPYGGLLGGLWEFPGGKIEPGETVEAALRRELKEEFGLVADPIDSLPPVSHAYTHLKVTLHPRLCRFVEMDPRTGEGQPWLWVPPKDLHRYAMPAANRKILRELERRRIADLIETAGTTPRSAAQKEAGVSAAKWQR